MDIIFVPLFILFTSWILGRSAYSIMSRCVCCSDYDDWVITSLIGFIVLGQIYCVIGLFSLLHRDIFLFAILVLSVPGIINIYKSFNKNKLFDIKIPDWKNSNLLILCIFPVIALGVLVSLLPPHNWDEISYGLTFPKLHIKSGNFDYLSEYGIFSAFPLFGEASIGIPMLLLNDPKVSHLTTLLFLPACIVLIYRICIFLGLNRFYSLISVIGFCYLPLTLANIGTAKNEIFLLTYILLSIYFLLISNFEEKYRFRLLSYLAIGFAGGIKYTTFFLVPFYLCLYIYLTPLKKGFFFHFKEFLTILFFVVGVNAAWLIINSVNLCNPVFPNLIFLFGQCLKYPVTTDIMQMVLESTMLQQGTSWETTKSFSTFLLYYFNAFGVINSIIGFLSLFVFYIYSVRNPFLNILWMALGMTILLFIQMFAIYWEFRYTYFIFPFILVFISLMITRLCRNKFISYSIVSLLVLQIYISFDGYIKSNPAIRLAISGQISEEVFKEKFIHLYWISKWINENTPEESIVGFNWGAQPFYYLKRNFVFFHDWNPSYNIQQLTNYSEFENVLTASGVSYLVWRNQDDSRFKLPSKSVNFHNNMNQFLIQGIENKNLVEIYSQDDVRIFQYNKIK